MKKNRKKLLKRVISGFLAVMIMFSGIPPIEIDLSKLGIHLSLFDEGSLQAEAADETYDTLETDNFDTARNDAYTVEFVNGVRKVTINSEDQLLEYSIAYNTFDNNHCTDIIFLSPTAGTQIWDLAEKKLTVGNKNYGGFQSIGDSNHPFEGKIQKGSTDTIKINLAKPLLGVVEQCTEVCELYLSRMTEDPQTTFTPIFATTIQNTTNATAPLIITVNLQVDTSNENAGINKYAGVIGSISENTSASLTVTNNMKFDDSPANVESTTAVGFLCGQMGTNSSLTATINSGTNTNYSVTSTSGAAGGLVGSMANGSKLILSNPGLNSITQSITGATYAGGIVGEATGAYIGVSDPDRAIGSMTITSSFKTASTTLSGTTASGYLFGCYTNTATEYAAIPADGDTPAVPASTVSNRTFTIDSSFRNVSLTFSSNNAGGYFGVLNNNATGATVTFDGGISNVANINDNSDKLLEITFTKGKKLEGGVVCFYNVNDLTNTLHIMNTYVHNVSSVVNKVEQYPVYDYGGAIADVSQSPAAAYIKIENFYTWQPCDVTQASDKNYHAGGLIYNSGSSFVDVSGNIRIKGKLYGGLIYSMPKGVLRLAGTTNLSEISTSEGLIVRDRTNGLIYSKGTGNDDGTGSSWKLIRNQLNIDDVYTWGEVVRLKGGDGNPATTTDHDFDLTNNTVIDETHLAADHYVEIPAHSALTSISGLADFMKLALSIQLKTGSTETDVTGAALKMKGTASATILSSDITLNSDIDLRGTGITGLTRDNGANNKYSGTFTGGTASGNHKITLAIGEAYGYKSNGTALAVNNNADDKSTGRIYRHQYNGLFAKLESGAEIDYLTVDGKIYVRPLEELYTGGFGASIESGTLNFNNDTSSVEIYFCGKDKVAYSGGFVSRIASSDVTLNFTDCTSDVEFYDNRGDTADQAIFFGGFVSMIKVDAQNVVVNFNKSSTGCILSGSYVTATDSNKTTCNAVQGVKYGGLIAYCENDYSNSDSNVTRQIWKTRKININNLTIEDLSIEAKVSNSNNPNWFGCAALLGYEWYGVDVTIADLSVGVGEGKACSIGLLSGSRTNVKMAGLCTIATGHWQIDKLNIQGLSVSGNSSSFGMIMNTACRPKNDYGMASMYLELTNMKDYTISSDNTKVSISGITNGLYDELAVYTNNTNNSSRGVTTNNCSVISINTDANANSPTLIMNGTACNTYQNQTYYGKNVTTHNPYSRYYYNLYYIRNKAEKTPAEQLLLWSVYQYAQKTTYKANKTTIYNGIETYFSNTFPSTGSFDMTGLSYYPIDYTAGVTLPNNTTLKFYNEQIERGETAGTGVSSGSGGLNNDGLSRTTSGNDTTHSQHYMMHCGLFRNYITGGKTIQTRNLTLKGSVGIYNGGSGFLVSGTFGNANSKVTFKPYNDNKNNFISLDGAYVYNVGSSTYAPLLINNVEKNSTIHIYGLKTTDTESVYSAKQANSSWYGASSLIGKVGQENGTSGGITLDFSKIWLDSRKTNGNLSTDSELTAKYGTYRSIFNRATLLHWFVYGDSESSGTYNYEYSEDSGSHKHEVTYGQEVYYTVDNNDDYPSYLSSQQLHYLGDKTHFTDPTGNYSSAYDFDKSKFLPYVGDYDKGINAAAPDKADHTVRYHELNVNLMVSSLDVGCGTYNDPYVISEAGQMLALAKILKGETIDPKFRINLPDSDNTNLIKPTGDRNLYWCAGDTDHITFYPDNGTYKRATDVTNNPATSHTYSTDEVRKYLAGAYYQITTDLTLSDKFAGIGVGDASNSGAFAFHGVIVGSLFTPTGASEARYPIITNKSASPLIVASNGSVVKNITVNVSNVNKTLSQDSPSTDTFEYNAGCASYGAVIGKIMGGDNIIDNVPVTFTNTVFTLGTGSQVVPIGGYVGVIVNGGLFFRSMSGDISGLALSSSSTTLSNGVTFNVGETPKSDILSSTQYLYINPIIGRVINGYAVTESSAYNPAEADVTMKNTAKNYSITDILTTDTVTIGTDSITADSAQDLFILSLIVNSGTGSKASALSYDLATFKATHIGTYDDVGCKQTKVTIPEQGNTVCDHALFASGYTELTDSATPYITVNYTSNQANAQVLTDSGKSYAITLSSSSHSYTLPDGYRGIGGFNSDNSTYQLGVSSINQNGSAVTVNLNMSYNTYEQTYDNYFTVATSGFGLFSTLVPSANCSIENLTLSGQVKVTAYDSSTGTEFSLSTDKNDTGTRDKYLSAGALAGIKSNNNSFTLNALTISTSGSGVYSRQNSGGFIGKVSGTGTVTVNNCNGTNLIIHSNNHSGGFFGYTNSPIRVNETSGTSVITVYAITQSNGSAVDSWTTNNSAGGLLGREENSIINNVTVSQASGGTGISLTSAKGGTGGLIGTSEPSANTNVITNCAINDLTVSGRRTAAVVGQYAPSSVKTVSITNVRVNGKTGSGTKATVERTSSGDVGTIIGYAYKTNVTIENCESKNYIIKSGGDSVGGCVGCVEDSSIINLKNYMIDGCEFQSSTQSTGGIIGSLGGSNSKVLGYNIAMKSITSTGTKYAADFVGSYTNKTLKIVGFSRYSTPAVSTASNYTAICSNAVCVSGTTQTELPSGSYIIFSDYNGIGYDGALNTGKPKVTDNTDVNIASMIDCNTPYATVNPSLVIDSNTKLTGDGIASTTSGLAITNILSDISSSASKAYTYAANFNGTDFDVSHLSTFNSQLGEGTVDNNFAILVLEDTNRYRSQEMINDYLQLLTNTRFNFADRTTNAAIYNTQLYKMELITETVGNETVKKFVKTGAANLKIDAANRFYMENDRDQVDTGQTTMFSLIDIQFYDPTDTSASPAVAYHLYVPVLVKKMLKYSFNIATGSGTIYDKTWYGDPSSSNSRYGKILLENLGTPGTLYFTYSYERTLREWQEALDYGENLLLNYDKGLSMTEFTAALDDMAADTMLVLVDTNQNDKSYYSRFSNAWSDGELIFYKSSEVNPTSFSSSMGSSGGAFKPVSMCDLMNISVTENAASGNFIALDNDTAATVKVGSTYYRPYDSTIDIGDNEPDMRYDLTVINKKGVATQPENNLTPITLTESYYLSFFTKKPSEGHEEMINYYSITSPSQLTGGAAAAKPVGIQSAIVLFGNLYQQTNFSVEANPYPSISAKANDALITDSNNMVRTLLSTKVSLTTAAKTNQIDSKLDDSVNIYQSFIVYLTKRQGGNDTKGVVGNPTATAEYKIVPVTPNETYPAAGITPTGTQRNELNYVEAASGQSIKDYLKNTDGAIITAELVLTYPDIAQRQAQFPVDQSSGEPTDYTFVTASSNVAYDSTKTAYSKNQIDGTDSNSMKYHIASGKEATLNYNAIADDKGNPYGQLGINANDLEDSSGKVKVKTNATYILTDVADDVPISDYPYIKVTFKLSQKQSRSTGYGNALQIGQYLENVMVKGTNITTATPKKHNGSAYVPAGNTDTEYVFVLDRNELKTNDNPNILSIPIEFNVYTGSSSFESHEFMYGNFRIDLTAQCLTNQNAATGTANAKNYIVYTNAKLITEFIPAS